MGDKKKKYLKKTIYCVCKNRKLVNKYFDLSRFSNLRFHRFLNGEFIILYLFLVLTSSFINNILANKNRDRLSVQMCPFVFDFTFSFLPNPPPSRQHWPRNPKRKRRLTNPAWRRRTSSSSCNRPIAPRVGPSKRSRNATTISSTLLWT